MKVLDRIMWVSFSSGLDCLSTGALLWVFARYADINVGDAPYFLWSIAIVSGGAFVLLFLIALIAVAFGAEAPSESRK